LEEHDDMLSHHGEDDNAGGDYPNETIRLLMERSSCRSYTDQSISPKVMQLLLEAGVHAATGGNLQPYSVIKIENKDTNKKLEKLCGDQPWVGNAAANLLFCIDWRRSQRWAELECAPYTATHSFRHFWISFQDTIIAAQNICTAADALGLGSVYIGTVVDCLKDIRDLCRLPKGVFPVVLLCLGYPTRRPAPKKKLGVAAVVHDEVYRDLSDADLLDAFEKKYPNAGGDITDERLTTIERVCREAHGAEFAEKCLQTIRRKGKFSMSQKYFGLHYVADEMPKGNEDFLKMVKEMGFGWFWNYEPPTK